MSIFDQDARSHDPRAELSALFDAAKQTDEFEFVSAMLRIRGLEDAHWDPMLETQRLTNQFLALMNTPIQPDFRLRLCLFLYCHLTEADALQEIVINLMRICLGERYSSIPFQLLPAIAGKLTPGEHLSKPMKQLIELSNKSGFPRVGNLYRDHYVRPVRNAFYHSDYVLAPDAFNIRQGEGIDSTAYEPKYPHLLPSQEHAVPLKWLLPRLELGINVALAIMSLQHEHVNSYEANQIVSGRILSGDGIAEIELITEVGRGVVGFRSPPSGSDDRDESN